MNLNFVEGCLIDKITKYFGVDFNQTFPCNNFVESRHDPNGPIKMW